MIEEQLQAIEQKLSSWEAYGKDDVTSGDVRALVAEVRRLRKPEKVSVRIDPGETRQVNGVPWRNCNDFSVTLLSSED